MVSPKPNSKQIQEMFDGLAHKYDLFNRLTSMGMDKRWRHQALEGVGPGMRVLDLGCGTGDLSLEAASKMKGAGEVVGIDFSEKMLQIAQKRYESLGQSLNGHFQLFQKRAEDLPLSEKPFDWVVSGFVLRNIYENIDAILRGVSKSLRNGGRVSFLDFTEPPGKLRLLFWKFYMSTLVVLYGRILFGKKFPETYMAESAQRFLKAPEFVAKLQECGFKNVTVKKFMMGIIVLYQAEKAN